MITEVYKVICPHPKCWRWNPLLILYIKGIKTKIILSLGGFFQEGLLLNTQFSRWIQTFYIWSLVSTWFIQRHNHHNELKFIKCIYLFVVTIPISFCNYWFHVKLHFKVNVYQWIYCSWSVEPLFLNKSCKLNSLRNYTTSSIRLFQGQFLLSDAFKICGCWKHSRQMLKIRYAHIKINVESCSGELVAWLSLSRIDSQRKFMATLQLRLN